MQLPLCPNPPPEFSTERLPLAIFLHAGDRLRFLRCEPSKYSNKLVFVFEDPSSLGSQTELEFDRGATVSAAALFASQKFLRRTMSQISKNLPNGVSHDYSQRWQYRQ